MAAMIAIAAVFGLVIGSFLNVVIYRVPLGLSVVKPRSRCNNCGHEITAIENVPVLSWLVLRGKCRECKAPISIRYPAIELLTGVLFAGVVADGHQDAARIALGLILMTALVPITFIDLETKRIPNVITGPAAIALVVFGTALDPSGEPERLLAAAIVFLPFFALAMLMSRSFGMGDVKLMAVMGLALGRALAPALFFAFIAGSVVGVGMMLKYGGAARKSTIPFGPFLALGGVLGYFVGTGLMNHYLDTFH
jgi:leader peptidase (prepilin peptidase)/N-methyltransferase